MRPSIKSICSGGLIVAFLTVLVPLSAVYAANPPREAIVIEARTGKVLIAQNPDARTYPASLTKMMTLYLLFDALSHGKLKLTSPVVMSAHGAAQAPSRLGLAVGESLTVEQAILAIVTKSANDVAVAVGETLAGDEASFAARMTTTARRLAMKATDFKNASGLPHQAQHTTARDMAILSLALRRDYPQYYHYFSVREFAWGNDVIPSHNRVLLHYPGADGLKTGFIAASGFNLATSATRGNTRLVAVVMGGASGASRDRTMTTLLDQGFALAAKLPPEKASPEPKQTLQKLAAKSTPAKPAASPPPDGMLAALTETAKTNTWGVLVGTYPTKVSAHKEASLAVAKLGSGLKVAVVATTYKKTTVYQGQVIGFESKTHANKACQNLKHSHIGQPKSCVVVGGL